MGSIRNDGFFHSHKTYNGKWRYFEEIYADDKNWVLPRQQI